MPEGPEVAVISDGLNLLLKNKKVIDISIFPTSYYRSKSPDNFLIFQENLPLKIKKVTRKGKQIYFVFEKDFYIVSCLGMTGYWGQTKEKHTSIELTLEKSSMYYIDQRHFGRMSFYTSKEEFEKKVNKLGPDLLNEKVSFGLFKKRLLVHPRWNITKSLMDQSIVSGIGNYLKAEILYDSKISPLHKVEDIDEENLKKLYHSAIKIIQKSYNSNGMSSRNYVDVDGNKGDYEPLLKVYGKKNDFLGNKVVLQKTKDQRNTYWVPSVQK